MHNNETDDFVLRDENQLSVDLIEAQYQLRANRGGIEGKSLLILLSGIELAGKGEAVQQLREWVDPRYLIVKADVPHLLTAEQPSWQPYANFIPKQGQMTLLFGNWYSDALTTALHISAPISEAQFQSYVDGMRAFEQDLCANHVHVIKIWIDLSWKALQKRLDKLDPSEQKWQQLHGLDWRSKAQYDNLQKIRQHFTDDWIVIDGENGTMRDQRFAQHILQALKTPLAEIMPAPITGHWQKAKIPEVLLKVPDDALDKTDYKAQLQELTKKVARAMRKDNRNIVIVFEGMDAAGKGGAIKRIVKKLDPREYEIHTIAAPEPHELSRPYLWRFWTKIPTHGGITIFDRSWYGRVLVERLEGFAKPHEWKRAYGEINRFEQNLTRHNTVLIKFWLAIDKDEQEKRFIARENTPHKRFKITDEDWRNRQKWEQYLQAAADMFAHTDTHAAPWHIVATNDKYIARLTILQKILDQLKAAQ
ncbi:phosphate--AMP phosphotransferase [Acinetobacter qingfengensis]|uniref:Phosphate--AMP phosphotransferase n=1 Tax=Acinetobacter qingfengensis TaxID=1262585 RepID=A0A1E7RE69_9GAMM|nr:phosphate--AMP phosphotransferase [Acinetobacter qingfengensis]KAA8733729.1 phosphate--AMP phosphotransferase [Acinetobacter qingfengensis]OEY97455.1 phosphate--AMP phosphotransferase [Acinetobacter qingfengensis]